MNTRLYQFFGFFLCLNLIFIPLLSLYGLRACPILSIPGFGFGCYYTAIYIGLTNFFNLIFLFGLISENSNQSSLFTFIKKYRFVISVFVYLTSTLIALAVLQNMLKISHLTTQSRSQSAGSVAAPSVTPFPP